MEDFILNPVALLFVTRSGHARGRALGENAARKAYNGPVTIGGE